MLRLSLLIAVASLYTACNRPPPSDQGFGARIAAEVHKGPDTVLDLRELAPFHWTRLYVFGPYARQEVAERTLGRSWPYDWSAVEFSEDRAFLVFVDSVRVVAAFDQTNDGGNFGRLFRADGYAPDSARFIVRQAGQLVSGAPNYELHWVP